MEKGEESERRKSCVGQMCVEMKGGSTGRRQRQTASAEALNFDEAGRVTSFFRFRWCVVCVCVMI